MAVGALYAPSKDVREFLSTIGPWDLVIAPEARPRVKELKKALARVDGEGRPGMLRSWDRADTYRQM